MPAFFFSVQLNLRHHPLHELDMSSPPSAGGIASTVDEVTPLLAASGAVRPAGPKEESSAQPEAQAQAPQHDERDDDTPLPKTQIFLLAYARMVEPIAFFTIFPFINEMIWETAKLKQEDVGFYSGLIVCSPSPRRTGKSPIS